MPFYDENTLTYDESPPHTGREVFSIIFKNVIDSNSLYIQPYYTMTNLEGKSDSTKLFYENSYQLSLNYMTIPVSSNKCATVDVACSRIQLE
jgi:hypothetical protein